MAYAAHAMRPSFSSGATLSHKMDDRSEPPVAFPSRSLTGAEHNYAQINREAIALCET